MSSTHHNPLPPADATQKQRFDLVLDIFTRAISVDPQKRTALLDELCGTDRDLRHQVELMLAADDQVSHTPIRTGSGTGEGAIDGVLPTNEQLKDLPKISGQYRVLRQLGEGGMGVVFLAEQALPRRLVALKAIRAGLQSRQILERFIRETHILGRLQDPGIAQIFEAGVLEDDQTGRAYIVMEYVDGHPVTNFAEEKALSRDQRIELVIKICAAVHYAHLKRVIHRDLKPANVLVNADGNPKILDFGIASLQSDSDEHLTITRDGQILGTPAYMAPEQIRGEETDTRADVYALGVILFELLTGQLPHDLTGLNLPSALAKVRSQPPRRAIAIDRSLPVNLDAILSVALATAPELRYQGADTFAADLRRFLQGEPIVARPEAAFATILRVGRRHQFAVAAGILGIVGLVASTIIFGNLSKRNADLARQTQVAKSQIEQQATDLKRALYVSRIGNAEAALAAGNTMKASVQLASCDPIDRGWEWFHIARGVDQSFLSTDVPSSTNIVVFSSDAGFALINRPNLPWIRLELASGKQTSELAVGSEMLAASISPNGQWLVGLSRKGPIELMSLSAPGAPRVIDLSSMIQTKVTPGGINYVTWLDEGREFLCIAQNGRGYVFDVDSDGVVREIDSNQRTTYDAKRRPHFDQWIACSSDLSVQVRSAVDGEIVLERKGLPGTPMTLAVSPDGMCVVIGCFDGRMVFWNLETNQVRNIVGHTALITRLAFSPDGKLVASGGRDRALKVWDFATGELRSSQVGETARIANVAWQSDTHIATYGDSKKIRVFRTEPLPLVPALNCLRSAPFGSDVWNQWLAMVSREGELTLLDHRKWSKEGNLQVPGTIRVKFAADGTMVTSAADGRLRFFEPGPTLKPLGECGDFDGTQTSLSVSANRSHMVAWQFNTRLGFIDTASRKVTKRISYAYLKGCNVLNDGSLLVTRASPNGVELIEPGPGRQPWTIVTDDMVNAADISEDERLLALSSGGGTVEIYDIATGKLIRTIPPGTQAVSSLQFFSHDQRLVGAGADLIARVWDVHDGLELVVLTGHRSYVSSVLSCDGGNSLLSIDGAGVVRKWRSDLEPGLRISPEGAANSRFPGN